MSPEVEKTKRQRILEAMQARLQEITVDNGFATDAGLHVALMETMVLGPDDPAEAIGMVVGEDIVRFHGARFLIELPVSVQAVARADITAPWSKVEAVIGDIKRAMELEDRSLGGLLREPLTRGSVRAIAREPGSLFVGAEVPYEPKFIEEWGDPL